MRPVPPLAPGAPLPPPLPLLVERPLTFLYDLIIGFMFIFKNKSHDKHASRGPNFPLSPHCALTLLPLKAQTRPHSPGSRLTAEPPSSFMPTPLEHSRPDALSLCSTSRSLLLGAPRFTNDLRLQANAGPLRTRPCLKMTPSPCSASWSAQPTVAVLSEHLQ